MDQRSAQNQARPALRVVIDSRDSLLQLHKTLSDMGRELMVKKNGDYAEGDDPFANFHDSGEFGILTRLGDKYKRLLNFERRLLANPKHEFAVSDESVEDTVLDLINYSILYFGYRRRRKGDR